jgi:hypothetical protein
VASGGGQGMAIPRPTGSHTVTGEMSRQEVQYAGRGSVQTPSVARAGTAAREQTARSERVVSVDAVAALVRQSGKRDMQTSNQVRDVAVPLQASVHAPLRAVRGGLLVPIPSSVGYQKEGMCTAAALSPVVAEVASNVSDRYQRGGTRVAAPVPMVVDNVMNVPPVVYQQGSTLTAAFVPTVTGGGCQVTESVRLHGVDGSPKSCNAQASDDGEHVKPVSQNAYVPGHHVYNGMLRCALLPVSRDRATRLPEAAAAEAAARWRCMRALVGRQPGPSLQRVATEAGMLLKEQGGDLRKVVRCMGAEQQHMVAGVINDYFGRGQGYDNLDALLNIVDRGVPVTVSGQGDLVAEWNRGNYPMAPQHERVFNEKVLEDVRLGRSLVFTLDDVVNYLPDPNRLRLCPVFVVQEGEEKFRVIHDLSAERDNKAGVKESVNSTTAFDEAPQVELGEIFSRLLQYVWQVRQKFPGKRIMISKMDVKSAFRQIPVSIDGVLLGYRIGDLIVIDLRLQFGWRSSPGFWSIAGGAIKWSVQQDAPGAGPVPSKAAIELTKHVQVIPAVSPRQQAKVPVDVRAARKCKVTGPEDPPHADIYVDDLIMAMVLYDDESLLEVTKSAAEAHVRLLGAPRSGESPISQHKVTHWDTTMLVLGWEVDTEGMVVRMPKSKQLAFCAMLDEFPPSKRSAIQNDVAELVGKLQWAAYGVPAGKFFLWRLRNALCGTGPIRKGPGARRGLVHLSNEAHADLAFWRWAVRQKGVDNKLQVPIAALVRRQPDRCWWSDASYTAVGGYCETSGVWWRYDLQREEVERLNRSKKASPGDGSIHVNLLELVGMVITAWVMIVDDKQAPDAPGAVALLRGDNTSAVGWCAKAGGARDTRCGGLIRVLGALELEAGWSFAAKHVQGKLNVISDGISRWHPAHVQEQLEQHFPGVQWKRRELESHTTSLITTALAKSWPGIAWESELRNGMARTLSSG